MLKQLRHKRFRTMNDISSSLNCLWYAMELRSIVPIGNTNDDIHKRSACIYT
ncbi:MAG TPA: hypothetical protein VKB95_13250 [Chitinophagaceae bacterium]|nr:hypothetical protein [Chitinophagaceae bacterium]